MATDETFPSANSPLIAPGDGGNRPTSAWYRFFVTLWSRSTISLHSPTGIAVIWSATGIAPGPPDGWLFCLGAAVSRTDFADLFALLGTAYGAGDGATTFNLPTFPNVGGCSYIIKT